MKPQRIIEKGINLLWLGIKVGICLLIGRTLGQVFLLSTYCIPTDSMLPTLLPGDQIVVNKTCMGARLFSLNDAFEHKSLRIYRTPGWSSLKAGEVAVFNYPYTQTRDSIGFDVMTYYVKRCWGTPGDSLSIVEGRYQLNGQPIAGIPQAVRQKQDSLHHVFYHGDRVIRGVSIKAFPKNKEIGWTIVNFGPLYIPKEGDVLELNRRHYLLYRLLIEWESGKKLKWENSEAWMDGRVIKEYLFKKNYYFMGGDNVFSSVDARYWGLLPEEYIAGKVVGIWKSVDPYTDEMRWERIGFIE